jgi:hypothetical protein
VATSRNGVRRRLLRYAYSNKNLVGCAAALVGLVLYFIHVVGDLWPLVVVGLYAVGALATPPNRSVDLRAGLDAANLTRAMAEQVRRVKGKVPDDVLAAVLRIHDEIREIAARSNILPPGSADAFVVEQTALDYLPTALESYLSLPRGYANRVAVDRGRTAKQVLLDQLALLESKLGEVIDAIARGDTDRLLAHGRFLADRFGSSELDLPRRPEGGASPTSSPTPPSDPGPTAGPRGAG